MKKKTPEEVRAQLALCEWLFKQKNIPQAVHKAHKMLTEYTFEHINDDPYPDERFKLFWDVYPKKVGKGDAYRKWRALKIGKTLGTRIIESVRDHMQTEHWRAEAGKFIPNPATYLYQKRYDDEVDGVTTKKPEFDVVIEDGVAKLTLRKQ